MKMKPLVSILIPAYNSEKWIDSAIKSALNQEWRNIEIIIVDDGSTDSTLRIAKSYESKTVKVISQNNRGACAARNIALECSKGDYIQWLDADDLLHPAKILEQIKVAEIENNSRVLFSSSFGSFFSGGQDAKFRANLLWHDLKPIEWMITKLNDNVWMSINSWLVSRKLTELAGPWDERLTWNDDGEYIFRVVSVSEKVKFVPTAVCYNRVGNINSLSSDVNRSDKRLQSLFLSIVLQNKYLLNLEYSDRTKSACIQHLQDNYIFFFPEKYELVKWANEFAEKLGGTLVSPVLKMKYNIIRKTMGWGVAKRAMFILPKWRFMINRCCSKYIKNIIRLGCYALIISIGICYFY